MLKIELMTSQGWQKAGKFKCNSFSCITNFCLVALHFWCRNIKKRSLWELTIHVENYSFADSRLNPISSNTQIRSHFSSRYSNQVQNFTVNFTFFLFSVIFLLFDDDFSTIFTFPCNLWIWGSIGLANKAGIVILTNIYSRWGTFCVDDFRWNWKKIDF